MRRDAVNRALHIQGRSAARISRPGREASRFKSRIGNEVYFGGLDNSERRSCGEGEEEFGFHALLGGIEHANVGRDTASLSPYLTVEKSGCLRKIEESVKFPRFVKHADDLARRKVTTF